MSEDKEFYEMINIATESDVAQVDGIERGRYDHNGAELGEQDYADALTADE